MKTLGKILLCLFSVISFVIGFLFASLYYVGGFGYLYHSDGVIEQMNNFLLVGIALFLVNILLIVIFLKSKKIFIKVISVIVIIVFALMCLFYGYISMLFSIFLGCNGCSYTTDVSNYGKYDFEFYTPHFPEEITEDMTYVDFAYYYKYLDRDQVDIYLEVGFDNRETMDIYLAKAKQGFSDKGVVSYQNPYNEKYTDITYIPSYNREPGNEVNLNGIYFGSYDDTYKYVDIYYVVISYSYEELRIIYNYTNMGSDIGIGDDPDNGYYYAHILERFGIEWDKENNFSYKYTFTDEKPSLE